MSVPLPWRTSLSTCSLFHVMVSSIPPELDRTCLFNFLYSSPCLRQFLFSSINANVSGVIHSFFTEIFFLVRVFAAVSATNSLSFTHSDSALCLFPGSAASGISSSSNRFFQLQLQLFLGEVKARSRVCFRELTKFQFKLHLYERMIGVRVSIRTRFTFSHTW